MRAKTTKPGWITACFILVALAGCLEDDSFKSLAVDSPRIGDTYEYKGSDGSTLIVRVAAAEIRADGFLRNHEAIILNWSLDWPGKGIFYFEESVDPVNGLIVHQVALCGTWLIDHSVDPNRPLCIDSRASLVFDAGGLPGAFGAAPLWASQRTANGQMGINTHSLYLDLDEIDFNLTPDTEHRRCTEISADEDTSKVAFLAQTVVNGPFVVCPEHPFPVRFTAQGLPPVFLDPNVWRSELTFVLTDWQRGDIKPETAPRVDSWHDQGTRLPRTSWQAPYFVQGHNESFAFTLEEAHQAAIEEIDEYRQMVEGNVSATLMRTSFSDAGYSTGTFSETTYFKRTIELVDQDGLSVAVALEKEANYTEPVLGIIPETHDEVIKVTGTKVTQKDRYPSEASVERNQSGIKAAFEAGLNLTGQNYSNQTIRLAFTPYSQPWTGTSQPTRTDGYELVMRYEVPPGREIQMPGGTRIVPYQAVFDGPTGGILFLHNQGSDLPFTHGP